MSIIDRIKQDGGHVLEYGEKAATTTTTQPLSDEALAELELSAKAATRGPWHLCEIGGGYWSVATDPSNVFSTIVPATGSGNAEDNCDFIARTNPETALALVEEVRRLRAEQRLIMAEFGIESDETVYETVARTSAAAVKLRDDNAALRRANRRLDAELDDAAITIEGHEMGSRYR